MIWGKRNNASPASTAGHVPVKPSYVSKSGFIRMGVQCALVITALWLADAVWAQGQTPTTPLQKPGVPERLLRNRVNAAATAAQSGKMPADNSAEAKNEVPAKTEKNQPPRKPDKQVKVAGPAAGKASVPAIQVVPVSAKSGKADATVDTGTPFEPLMEHAIQYPALPDTGEPITLVDKPEMPLMEFLAAIQVATNWNVVVSDGVQDQKIRCWLQNARPAKAMEVLRFHGVYYEFDSKNQFLSVMTTQEYLQQRYGTLQFEQFEVKHADLDYVRSMLSEFLSANGRIMIEQRSSSIYVWDTEDNLKHMRAAMKQLDIPLKKREFFVRHADVSELAAALQTLLSTNGNLISDSRTGVILVWDQEGVLNRMQDTVARMDVPLEVLTLDIKYASAADLLNAVTAVLSERGMVQADPRSNALVVTDMPSRLTDIEQMVQRLDRKLETKTWVVQYADLDFVAEQLASLVSDEVGEIIVNKDVHQITVTSLPERLELIEQRIATWDVKRRQVLIEAFIVEAGQEVERAFNINWSYYDTAGKVPLVLHGGSGATGIAEPGSSGEVMSIGQLPYAIPMRGDLGVDEGGNLVRPPRTDINDNILIDHFKGTKLAVALDYLDEQNKATILSSPRVTVQDGEEATFQNATEVPYVSATTIHNNLLDVSYGRVSNRVEFIDVGTILTVLPRIARENTILLDISAEDSTFVDKSIVTNDQISTIPEKTMRRAETQLRVKSGETIVLGGLRRDRATHSVSKTPFLGDVPLLGRLFRNPNKETRQNSLLIFITTTIVGESSHPEVELLAQAEDRIARQGRTQHKDLWGRLHERIRQGNNEILISIGHRGDFFHEGDYVSLEELEQVFQQAKSLSSVKVVIRRHPRAPGSASSKVLEAALAAGIRVEFEEQTMPIVPQKAAS